MSIEKRLLFDKLCLGCISYLESFDDCHIVNFSTNDGITGSEVPVWERKNNFKLPEDLKNFYKAFNGFNLNWSVQIVDRLITVGIMKINKLEEITKNTTEFISQFDLPPEIEAPTPSTCTIFNLDSSSDLGDVILLYRNQDSISNKPEIWFLDTSGQLHFIAKNFTHYLRLLVVHLGIYGWILAFTDDGLPEVTQNWMNIFCKERLIIDRVRQQDVLNQK